MRTAILPAAVLALLAAITLGPPPAVADTLSDASITVDARTAGTAEVRYDLTWTSYTARSALRLYLSEDVTLKSATSEGAALDVSPENVRGTTLRAWTVKLAGGASKKLSLTAEVGTEGSGGSLLPGTGWFPQVAPESDVLLTNTTTFLLPEGVTGIAAGEPSGAGTWTSGEAGRPYAVWGDYREEAVDGTVFTAWRRSGAAGGVPRVDVLGGLVENLEIGMGPACGSGGWKLVDVGNGVIAGGQRTLFWDEKAAGAALGSDDTVRFDRDLAGGLAAAVWTECVPFRGELAALLSRGFALYLGDAAYSAREGSEDRYGTEPVIIGSRRAAFLKARAEDRSLTGLVPQSPGAEHVLATRGALVAHQLAETRPSRSTWITNLRRIRNDRAGTGATWMDVGEQLLGETGLERATPLLETTDLPDFRIVSHAPVEAKIGGERYRVEVENAGTVGGSVEVATFDANGRMVHAMTRYLGVGKKTAIMFGHPNRTARVALDPRGVSLQSEVKGESVKATPTKPPTSEELANYVPAFSFEVEPPGARAVEGLDLQLDGVDISRFSGWVVPYRTQHGPSGAALLGSGTVTIHPGGDFASSWSSKMGEESVAFVDSREIWVRFPVSKWKDIEPQLGTSLPNEDRAEVVPRQIRIHQYSFPTYFYEENRAQVPPPGSSLVVFTKDDGGRRGFVRMPMPDGTLLARFWDQAGSRETLWEERR